MKVYLGIDVGSVTTKCAVLAAGKELIFSRYIPTGGNPVKQVQKLLKELESGLPSQAVITGVGTTGSARYLAGEIVGSDVIKNEITAHAVAAVYYLPNVSTVLEIGGQDSKIIIIRDGAVTDFGMNTICAAGTGSFLDHQALRLGIDIQDLDKKALGSKNPVRIAGRCTVFAESDMIHKQQLGHGTPDILYGLCQALVHNFLSNVGLGKELKPPYIFQGGVAFNRAIVKAFEEELGQEVIVPPQHEVMGAIGAAMLALESSEGKPDGKTNFKGFGVSRAQYKTSSFVCDVCAIQCEIAQLKSGDAVLASWGGRCELWEIASDKAEDKKRRPDKP